MVDVAELCTTEECILSCELSPFPTTDSLLAFGTESLLVLATLDLASKSLLRHRSFQHGPAVVALAWSPLSHLPSEPHHPKHRFILCTGGSDHKVRLFDVDTSTSPDSPPIRFILEGHQGAITRCSYTLDGSTVASGSEDRSVRLWGAHTGECLRVLKLSSACMSLSYLFNRTSVPEDEPELLVAERGGVVRVLRGSALETVGTCAAPNTPIESADSNEEHVALLGGGLLGLCHRASCVVTDTRPVDVGASKLRISGSYRHLVVVAGPHKAEVVRFRTASAETGAVYVDGPASDASWHVVQPACVVAQGTRLLLLTVQP